MLVNIQFLRFVAAMMVVVYHAGAHVGAAGANPGGLFAAAEAVGFAGVDVFFVISGFIMFHTTREISGPGVSAQFLRKRVSRIYSGYWPFFLLAWALFAWVNPARLADIDMLQSATLWPGRRLLIAVSWTLTFEMIFYLLFTGLVLLKLPQRILTLKWLFGFIVVWTIWAQGVTHAYDRGQLETISLAEYYLLSPYLGEFLAGSLVAWWLNRSPEGAGVSWLLLGVAGFVAGGLVNTHVFGSAIEQGYTVVPRVLMFGSASVMVVVGLVRMEHRGIRAPLGFSLAAGGASYAIYLSHTLILTLTQYLGLNAALHGLSDGVVAAVFTALSLLILFYSMLHYRIVERPLHHLFMFLTGVRRSRP
jgi:exopolysaccharide production protein ExoZ